MCSAHKLEGMVDVRSRRCSVEGCDKLNPTFNLPTETKGLVCFEHKQDGMINVRKKTCDSIGCKDVALYGRTGKRAQFCPAHTAPGLVNVVLESKCCVLDCDSEFLVLVDDVKYCLKHSPDERHLIAVKRLCRYCDIKEKSTFVCTECRKISCRKEWAVVRHLRKVIDTCFEYNSSRMLDGCSKKRPDVFFDLQSHCVIVEIDEHQHRGYEDSCECARLSEIVGAIGGRSVVVIRFNPDPTRKAGRVLLLELSDKIDLLVTTVKRELMSSYDRFIVKLVQLYFDDVSDLPHYEALQEEDITLKVAV